MEVMLLLHDGDNSSQVQIAEQINNLLVTSTRTHQDRSGSYRETHALHGKVDADETIRKHISSAREGDPGCPSVYQRPWIQRLPTRP